MNAKLLALSVLVTLFAIPLLREQSRRSSSSSAGDIQALLPERVGEYRALEQWNRELANPWLGRAARYERGALYSRAGHNPNVEVDLLLTNLSPHNALLCRLYQGSATRWSKLQTVRMANSEATLEISLAREAGQDELIASTECSASGCVEQPLTTNGFVYPHLDQMARLFQPEPPMVVPVAILVASNDRDGRDCSETLLREFNNFVAIFDLSRIRSFAARAR